MLLVSCRPIATCPQRCDAVCGTTLVRRDPVGLCPLASQDVDAKVASFTTTASMMCRYDAPTRAL